jgi:transcription termination factor Rho
VAVLARKELEESPLADLHAIASELRIEGFRRLRREDLIGAIVSAQGGEAEAPAEEPAAAPEEQPAPEEPEPEEPEPEEPPSAEEETRGGVLDILPNGSGFMRADAFAHSADDVYVSPAQIRRCELRSGDEIGGIVRPPRRSERYPSLVRIETVNGEPAEPPAERPRFEDLTPVFGTERLAAPEGLDSVPFGKGSRVAIAGPPHAGATALLRAIASTLADEHGDLDVAVVLAGVRPEEVTEWRRGLSVPVAGGGFDRPVAEQAQAAEMAIERGKRVAERGGHAAVLVDSLESLPPAAARRVFGAARNTEEAGSLTVIGTTGPIGELQRMATTRIVLGAATGEGQPPLVAEASSGTTHRHLLS